MPIETRETEVQHGGQLSDGDCVRLNDMTATVTMLNKGGGWSASKFGFEYDGEKYVLRYYNGNWSCYRAADDDDLGEWGYSTADEVEVDELARVTAVDIVAERKQYLMEMFCDLLQYPSRFDDTMRPYNLTGSQFYRARVGEYMQDGKLPEVGGETTISEYEYAPFDELDEGDIIRMKRAVNSYQTQEVVGYDGDTLICVKPGFDPDRYSTYEYTRDDLGACVERKTDETTVWLANDYFLTTMMGLLFDHGYILKSEAELAEAYDRLSNAEMPNLPSDGSKGQWRTSMNHKLTFLSWLLGHDIDETAD